MIKDNGMYEPEEKDVIEKLGKIVDKEIFKHLHASKFDLDGFLPTEVEQFYDSIEEVIGYSELFPDRVLRYLEMLRDMFGDKLEEFDGVTPRTTAEIMKEYGLDEEDYH